MKLPVVYSIRTKLFLFLVGITSITTCTALLLFYLQITKLYSQTYQHDLQVQAMVLGANCQAALTFNLPDDATSVLAKLDKHPTIVRGKIFDLQGRLFAQYTAVNSGELLSGQLMTIKRPISVNGQVIGNIQLQDNMYAVRQFKGSAFRRLLLIMLVLALGSIAIVMKLCSVITKPMLDLAELADQVAKDQDYSRRANVSTNDEVGQLSRSLNTMLETIDHKTSEIRASERRFRMLVEQGVDAFFMYDHEGQLVNVNRQACNSLGYSQEELLNMTVADVNGTGVSSQDMIESWRYLESGRTLTVDSYHQRKDGSSFPVEVRMGKLDIGDKCYIMALARDVTERLIAIDEKHAIELQLQQAQKMESIGTLAGGIAHDFNNILSAILGYSELAMMEAEPEGKIYGHLDQIRKAGDRAADLVKQILVFSRKQQQEMVPLQLFLIVKEALNLLRASIPSTIKIEHEIVSRSNVLADATQIHQVMMNLCTNAYHSMADKGGVLSVSLKEIDLDSPILDNGEEIPPGRYVVLSISDTGNGMDTETMARIFEPYFTTKETGRGTGLGLSVVLGIIKSHHGRIGVYSEPGQGTTFNVYLPLIIDDIEDNVPQELPPPAHGERVMFVDDEESICLLFCQFLNDAGYVVDNFSNGREAWLALEAEPARWDILVTDRTMPEMTGEQLIAKLRTIRPDMPIVLCSGYNSSTDEGKSQMEDVVYLEKPIERAAILNCLDSFRHSGDDQAS